MFILNKNLTNGLLLIHPVILYFSYAYIIFIIIYIGYNYFLFINYNNIITFKKIYIFKVIFYLNFSIFLGSWWAEQELNW
jgi:cytochrome c biogenesis factor